MSDIRGLVQTTLDTAMTGTGVYVFWQRRVEISSATNKDEYVVYTAGGDRNEAFADNNPLVKNADVTVKYFYRAEKISTQAGRAAVKAREDALMVALQGAGFSTPTGAIDAGDVDDIGYLTSVIECGYSRVAS